MRIGTTPTHSFSLPFPVSNVAEAELTYMQERKIVLQKYLKDLTVSGNELSYKLTEKETFLFKYEPQIFLKRDLDVYLQLRVVSPAGDVLSSDVMRISPLECISNKVLTEVDA